MISVQPPEDWTSEASAATGGEFADIENVLTGEQTIQASQDAGAAAARDKSKPKSKPKPGPQAKVAPTANQPLLPGEQWTSTATQQKRKWLLLAAGTVTIFALAGAVFLAIAANRETPDKQDPVAINDQNDWPGKKEESEPKVETKPKVETEPADPDETQANVEPPVDANGGQEQVSEQPEFETGSSETGMTAEPTSQVPVPAVPGANGESVTEVPAQTPDVETVADDSGDPPFGSSFDDLLNESNVAAHSVETNFSELSAALESAGASLYEFNQIASVNERGRIGAKKYFVFQPEPLDPKKFSGLNLPIEGLQYNDQSLLTILAEFFEVTGVPITLDADLLNAAGFEFGYRTNEFKMTKTTFVSVIEKLLDEIGGADNAKFSLQYDGTSPGRVTIADRDERRPVRLPAPKIDDDDPQKQLVELIKKLTGEENWGEGNQPASLTLEGDELVVVNSSRVVSLVRKFVTSWGKALSVTSGESNSSVLQSVWAQSQAAKDRTFKWNAKHDTPILQFVAALQEDSKVNIVIDWQRLLEDGWNPRTAVPPDLDDATVGELLDELTHSMDLAYRVINPDTFEITTIEQVNELSQLEFHSCHSILAGKLGAEQLVDVVRNALRSTGQNLSAWHVVFEPGIKCFIAVGPQTLHRQIDAILKRMEKL